MEQKVGASARVTVTLEIDAQSNWGEGCSVKQVHDQGAQDAVGALERLIREAGQDRKMRIIGEPVVTAVFVKRAQA